MIADALKYLRDLAAESMEPRPLSIPGSDREKRYVINGSVHQFPFDPAPRDHKPGSLDDLIRLANRFDNEATPDGEDDAFLPVVWYDAEEVVLVIDDQDHRIERATLSLEYSDVFLTLMKLRADRTWFEQKPFVRLLRIDLAGTLEPVALLDRVRKLRWENTQATHGTVTRNSESLGREINSRVDAADPIPEEVVLMVPVYKTVGETDRLPLRCTVDTDPALGRLQLLPLPDEIERVLSLATADIGARLSRGLNDSIPCYLGKP